MSDRKIHRRPYGPPHVDGFRDKEEEASAFCPREKKKKTPAEHRKCDFHEKQGISGEEAEDAALCSFEEEKEREEDEEEAEEKKN